MSNNDYSGVILKKDKNVETIMNLSKKYVKIDPLRSIEYSNEVIKFDHQTIDNDLRALEKYFPRN